MMAIISVAIMTSCDESNEDVPVIHTFPELHSVTLRASDNAGKIGSDVTGEIVGDSIVKLWVPKLVDDKNFLVDIDALGGVYVDGKAYSKGMSYNFRRPVNLTLVSDNIEKSYMIFVYSFTGLPVMWIDTQNKLPIEDKETYIPARIKVTEDIVLHDFDEEFESGVNVKGRGNSTWNRMPKKPYRLKFDEKVSLLGEPKDKSWVLLANYADKTMLRNHITNYMGSISQLECSHFFELVLNGEYVGTYQLTDKLKIAKHRVNVGDDGFLLEIDDYAPKEDDARYFKTPHLRQPVNVKDPDVEYGDERFNYIKDYVTTIDSILYSPAFADFEKGWQKWLDMDSFVDWYIINEITKNTDGVMWSSCFMNIKQGGKLKMGPLWDYDLAYANYEPNADVLTPEGFRIKTANWFERLFKDPIFVQGYLRYAAEENDKKWGTLNNIIWPNAYAWGSYQDEVQFLKDWISTRMDWLYENINTLE